MACLTCKNSCGSSDFCSNQCEDLANAKFPDIAFEKWYLKHEALESEDTGINEDD